MEGQRTQPQVQGTTNFPPGTQICHANIMFALPTDDEALAVKKRLGEAVNGLENVRFQFSMTTVPLHAMPDE